MIRGIFGSRTADLVLLFLARRGEACATEIARDLDVPVNMVQKQLERFERAGVVESRFAGRRRNYGWNRRFPGLRPLRRLLDHLGACVAEDPADGSFLPLEERIELARELASGAAHLNPHERPPAFAKSFGSFTAYEAWRSKQKNPWLV